MLVAVGWPSFMVNNGCGCNMDGQGMKRTRVVARTSSLQSLKDSAAGWILLALSIWLPILRDGWIKSLAVFDGQCPMTGPAPNLHQFLWTEALMVLNSYKRVWKVFYFPPCTEGGQQECATVSLNSPSSNSIVQYSRSNTRLRSQIPATMCR